MPTSTPPNLPDLCPAPPGHTTLHPPCPPSASSQHTIPPPFRIQATLHPSIFSYALTGHNNLSSILSPKQDITKASIHPGPPAMILRTPPPPSILSLPPSPSSLHPSQPRLPGLSGEPWGADQRGQPVLSLPGRGHKFSAAYLDKRDAPRLRTTSRHQQTEREGRGRKINLQILEKFDKGS